MIRSDEFQELIDGKSGLSQNRGEHRPRDVHIVAGDRHAPSRVGLVAKLSVTARLVVDKKTASFESADDDLRFEDGKRSGHVRV